MFRPSPKFYAVLVITGLGVLSAVAYGLLVFHVQRTFG